uniref:DUF938 domain-containing protein n=1 Tax=Chrysemys picta bellii TaxID=8478 RepID=A0A8C3FZY1_CHRPI
MLVSPMAERNKELILEVLADYVDNTSQAFGLELASGTGQHVVHFAQALPNVTWQPSEISPSAHERNPAWGLRDVEELRQLATPNALRLERMVRFSVVWETGRFQGFGLSCREPRSY